ncbi:Fur family transcriptional regulator [Arcobacter caeni]|uniref:Ferric uptake regulation protein n=1 Tax=Arcobacter caeni TaxID=1912877 RepID=A0A363D414_9BACT|nr:transcriptional repressor [Arcobacter caeni]PUE66086.1 transcriptional repressor [Arcobacter caeni]
MEINIENNQEISFDIFLRNFRNNVSKIGLKNSIQKDYILKILYFSKEHLTADEISNKIKQNYNVSIGIATVYRAMKFFHDIKLINQLDIGDGVIRYELNIAEHHDHLICTSCGIIIEFSDDVIELKQISIAEKNNFILKEHVMTIYGICETCQ